MNIPSPLLRDIAMHKCLPFIGAGFSLNCDLRHGSEMPDWLGLGGLLAEEGGIDPKLPPPEIASLYESRFGRVQLIESIRHALHVDEAKPGEAHLAFASLPFDTVYTTNFDLLLESAYQQLARPFRSLVGELQIPFHGGMYTASIVKMHGDLRHEEHMIVTTGDFDDYLAKYPVISTHLSAMLIIRTGLYIGYGYSDPDFLHIKEVVRSRLGQFERMAYIIQFDSSDEEHEKMLQSNLHLINLRTDGRKDRGTVLIEFLREMQTRLEAIEATSQRDTHPEAFEHLDQGILEKSLKDKDSSLLLTSSSNMCLVFIPFGHKYEFVYKDLIRPAAEVFGLEVMRPYEIQPNRPSTEQLGAAIHQSRICIADITGHNANVLYEVGIARALGKPTILLSEEGARIPFQLTSERVLAYKLDQELFAVRKELEDELRRILMTSSLSEAETFLEQNSPRSAVARASIYLEHAMRELLRQNEAKMARVVADGRAERLTLARMVDVLSKSDIISRDDALQLRRIVAIRNNAVHALEETSADEARAFVQVARDFSRKYLRTDFGALR
jgi:hypothetical protein